MRADETNLRLCENNGARWGYLFASLRRDPSPCPQGGQDGCRHSDAISGKAANFKGEAVLAVYIGGTFLLVLVAFAAGLFARSFRIEKDAASFLEETVLSKLPPYVAMEILIAWRGWRCRQRKSGSLVLAPMHNGWQLGFVTDAFSDGHVAVFVAQRADPSSGVVRIISAAQVAMLDISYQDALACLEQSGRGLHTHLAGLSLEQQKRSIQRRGGE